MGNDDGSVQLDGHRFDLGRHLLWSERHPWVGGVVLYLTAFVPVVGWVAVAMAVFAARAVRGLRQPHSVLIGYHGLTLAHGRIGGPTPGRALVVPFAEIERVLMRGSGFELMYRDGRTRYVPCRRNRAILEQTVAHIQERLQHFRDAEAKAPAAGETEQQALRTLLEGRTLG